MTDGPDYAAAAKLGLNTFGTCECGSEKFYIGLRIDETKNKLKDGQNNTGQFLCHFQCAKCGIFVGPQFDIPGRKTN